MPATRDAKRPEYVARLDFETKTIVQMGFAGYFLIVADFINWAKGNGVPVGPGRGSGAGSLVAYALGITDLDPLRYVLLFERFLNPERVSMPDFDIDFCQDGRDRVIDYVKKKYGADSVSQIATFGTMAAKAAVRDVGRVLDLPVPVLRRHRQADPVPARQARSRSREARDDWSRCSPSASRTEEEVRELLALAESLEGLTRNVGMHAGGVLIAPGKLTDFCPLYTQAGSDAIVSQFDKDDVEAVGLVKFDFLGLTTLTILDWTLRYVKRLDPASDAHARDAAARRQGRLRHLQDGQHGGGVPVRIARHARPADSRRRRRASRTSSRWSRSTGRDRWSSSRLHRRARPGASASTIPIRGSSRSSARPTA